MTTSDVKLTNRCSYKQHAQVVISFANFSLFYI